MIGPSADFTFQSLKRQLEVTLNAGYRFLRCRDYAERMNRSICDPTIVFRIDVDFSMKRAETLAEIFDDLGIHGTFFIRLHAPEYNPFSFDNYRILARIRDAGHEIGYHSEVIDQAHIWGEDAEACLRRDLDVLSRMIGVEIVGAASHGANTGHNNLDFWANRRPEEFGLLYEGYDRTERFGLFHHSLYLSESNWTYWKAYKNGSVLTEDRRNLAEHVEDNPQLIYLLIHPDTWYHRHIYE